MPSSRHPSHARSLTSLSAMLFALVTSLMLQSTCALGHATRTITSTPTLVIASQETRPFSTSLLAPTPPLTQNPPSKKRRKRMLDEEWFHHPDHPAHAVFQKRQQDTQNRTAEVFPQVGSAEWRSRFPTAPLTPKTPIPQSWLDALNKAKAAGLVPTNVPLSRNTGVDPIYPNGTNPGGGDICSSTYKCRDPDDVWDAPDGRLGIAFDDGPLPNSPELYSFLHQQNQTVTHFYIGANILANPNIFLQAYEENKDDIACHTYDHPYMTTLTDEMVVAELGWTLEIIRMSTGGRITRYWRPPYGDVDNRVRAIAKHVFGLTTVIWNRDSLDWGMPNKPTQADVSYNYTLWLTGPKVPGLLILSHELNALTVKSFMDHYHLVGENGWDARSIPDLFGGGWYVNARNDTTEVVPGVQVAENAGQPVWSGFTEESLSLGTTTRLRFSSTTTSVASSTVVPSAAGQQVSNANATLRPSICGTSCFLALLSIFSGLVVL